MLGINRIKGGGEGYYLDAVAEGIDEYYRGVGEAPGWWAGTLAGDHLDLAGEIDSEDLRAVWGGLDPRTGVKLGRFNGREVNGFDLCWRAPKSVSLLFAFGSPEISRVVREAHDHAVDESLRYLERHAARTRKGQRGINGESVGGLAVAMFRHRTSRTGDPHLHTHGLAANIAKADDGIWRTLDGRLLFNHAKTAGFLYQAELRHELSRRLGVEWTPVEKGVADIVGIDRSVIWEFSERRRQIIEHLDEVGFRTARAAQIATLATRPDKTTPDETSIWRVWEAKAETIDFEPTSVNDVVVGPREVVIEDELVDGLLDRLAGPEGLTQNDSTFDRRHALMGLAEGLPEGAPVALVEDLAERFLRRPDIVALGESRKFTRAMKYSTVELLELEERLVTGALNRGIERVGVAPETAVDAAIAERSSMSDEQVRMTERLCLDGSGVAVVAAPAGAGKTFALGAAFDAWRWAGFDVVGTAVAARAARELEKSSGIPSRTLAKLTKELREGRLRLGIDSVVVVDECGMAGTRALAPILDAAQEAGAKVVLVGDPKQLPEIEAGGMLNALTKYLDPIALAENRRQCEDWERHALAELRAGDVDEALDAFERHGRLISGSDSIELRQRMVDEWWAARSAGKEVAMVALRHSDVDDLNGRARLHVVAAGRVSGPELEVNERLYQAGDEIVCLRNDYRLGVRNGDQAMVERVDAERRTMRVRLADGVRTLPTDYLDEGHIAHAYATTIHKAQGSTVNRSLVLGTDDLYREAGYVALSRGREANTLYTVGGWGLDEDLTHAPSRERGEGADLVREGLSRENSKRLAVEEPDIDRAEQDAGLRRIRARLDALEQRGQQVPDRNLGL